MQAVSSKATAWMGTWTELPLGWELPNKRVCLTETLACSWLATELAGRLKGGDECRGQGQHWSWEQEGAGSPVPCMGTWKLPCKLCFSFPTFSHANILLVHSKDKNSVFCDKAHSCWSQRHSFLPKPCICRNWLSPPSTSRPVCTQTLITHCILIPKLWVKISSLTHTRTKPLTPKTGKIEFFVLIAQKQEVKHETKALLIVLSFFWHKAHFATRKLLGQEITYAGKLESYYFFPLFKFFHFIIH